ncbi:MAG: hypothetical protein CSA52_01495, partial [Gammaproteobacteria bacterium]
MLHCYLFEAKAIQSYLFASGKLRDIISASERLDRLIDSTEDCALYKVLENASLESDLIDPEKPESHTLIRFLRCKGGAFYACCNSREPLVTLRSLWTLTIQQLFPSLEFTDALSQGDDLPQALKEGHQLLAANRNTPDVKFPVGKAILARDPRTGKPGVPMSDMAKRASKDEGYCDLDTEHHRQAYQLWDMRGSAALQDNFTPNDLKGRVHYPIDFDHDFNFQNDNTDSSREAIKDMALIHIDGNGLGIILRQLNQVLADKTPEAYRKAFRHFSDALGKATVIAAQRATQFV